MDSHLERGRLLVQQGRGDLAEPELRQALAQSPEDPVGHLLLSVCLRITARLEESLAEAKITVRLAPDWPLALFALARSLDLLDRLDEAELAITEAIRLDPQDADFHALRASLRLQQSDGPAALHWAEQGLACDPDNSECLNLRAMALTRLGRRSEAAQAVEGALARDPDNAQSHAVLGWNFLHAGNPRQALEHFREALRIDPDCEYARLGLIEALKARHLVYKVMLAWFLWMGRLSGKARWAIIIGLVLAARLLRSVARTQPALAPIVRPLLVLYFLFFMLSWTADPLFNLMLRLNKFGRHALSRRQVIASNWVGGFLAVCLLSLLLGLGLWLGTNHHLIRPTAFLTDVIVGSLLLSGWACAMLVPVSATFGLPAGHRRFVGAYTLGLAAVGLTAVANVFFGFAEPGLFVNVFLIGWVLFSWVAAAK